MCHWPWGETKWIQSLKTVKKKLKKWIKEKARVSHWMWSFLKRGDLKWINARKKNTAQILLRYNHIFICNKTIKTTQNWAREIETDLLKGNTDKAMVGVIKRNQICFYHYYGICNLLTSLFYSMEEKETNFCYHPCRPFWLKPWRKVFYNITCSHTMTKLVLCIWPITRQIHSGGGWGSSISTWGAARK